MELRNRTAVVTGGSTGMGFAAAQELAAEGVRVALLARREDLLREKARQIGGIAVVCDVSSEESVEAALDTVERELGTPSILVNSAGDGRMRNLVSPSGVPVDGDYIRDLLATNVAGLLYMCRGFVVRLARTEKDEGGLRGVIINVSSIGAMDGVMGSTYPITKGAVNSACLSLAREFSPWGIRVVTIAPGGIDTEMYRDGLTDGLEAMMKASVPSLRRPGRPEEFGKLALHICQNDYLNGTIVRLDGGLRCPFSGDVGGDVEAVAESL